MNFLAWLTLCVIWGTTWFFIKLGLRDLPPLSFAALRFVLALAFLAAVLAVNRVRLPRSARDWLLLAVTGCLQFTFNYTLVFGSEQYISSGLAAVLQAMIPAFGLLMAAVHLPSERITGRKIAALLIGISGVGIIFRDQLRVDSPAALAASIAIVAGAFGAAEASIPTKAFGGSMNPASLLFGQMLCGTAPLLVLAVLTDGSPFYLNWTLTAVISLLYLALAGTIAAFLLYYWLLNRVESSKAMTISLITPLLAVLIGAVLLGESIRPQAMAGGVLVLGAVGITVLSGTRSAASVASAEG
jgi:drug/metabolite transporter (DMT)-like permease